MSFSELSERTLSGKAFLLMIEHLQGKMASRRIEGERPTVYMMRMKCEGGF